MAWDSREGQEKDLQRQWGADRLVLGASRPLVRQLHSNGFGEVGLAGRSRDHPLDPLQDWQGGHS